MKRRLLALLLTFVMLVSAMPMSVWAGDGPTYVAQIGDNKYTKLQDAINAAKAGDTITLLENDSCPATVGAIIVPWNVLEENGFPNAIRTSTKAIEWLEEQPNNDKAFVFINKAGNYTIDATGKTLTGGISDGLTWGGSVSIDDVGNTKSYNALYMYDKTETTINILGGTFKGGLCTYRGTTINVTDGSFECNHEEDLLNAVVLAVKGKINISGGKFKGNLVVGEDNSSSITVSGGYFSVNPANAPIYEWNESEKQLEQKEFANYVADGYEAVALTPEEKAVVGDEYNYKVVIDENAVVAKIGETGYPTLQAAINAANSGETVVLLADFTDTHTAAPASPEGVITIPADKNIVIDLNGHTVDGGKLSKVAAILNYGTVEIKDTAETKGLVKRDDVKDDGRDHWYVIKNEGTMTLTGINVSNGGRGYTSGGGATLIENGDDTNATNAQLTVNGGNYFNDTYTVIKIEPNTTVTINGGTFDSTSGETTVQTYGTVTVNGGNFTKCPTKYNDYGKGIYGTVKVYEAAFKFDTSWTTYIQTGSVAVYDATGDYKYQVRKTAPTEYDAKLIPDSGFERYYIGGAEAANMALGAQFSAATLYFNVAPTTTKELASGTFKTWYAEGVDSSGHYTPASGYALVDTLDDSTGVHTYSLEVTEESANACVIHSDGSVDYYATLVTAGKAAQEGETVKALEDNKESKPKPTCIWDANSKSGVTVDLAGKQVDYNLAPSKAQSITIIDSVGGAKATSYISSYVNGTEIVIKSGGFTGTLSASNGGVLRIEGGYFVNDPAAYVKEGYERIELTDESTGADKAAFDAGYKYKVQKKVTYVAQIGDVKYETLADAVKAQADASSTVYITLLADTEEDISPANKTLYLDMNGHNVTGSAYTYNSMYLKGSGTYTLTALNGGVQNTNGSPIHLADSVNVVVQDAERGGAIVNDGTGTVTVTGGTWAVSPTAYVNSDTYDIYGNYSTTYNTAMFDVAPKGSAVAKIGDTLYATVNAALLCAKDNETVELIKDCTIDTTAQSYHSNVTLDGKGFTISGTTRETTGGGVIYISGGSLTVKNVTITGFTIPGVSGNASSIIRQNSPATGVTMDNVTFSNNNVYYVLWLTNGEPTLKNSVVTGNTTNASLIYCDGTQTFKAENNKFANNTVGGNGVVQIASNVTGVLTDNTFINNTIGTGTTTNAAAVYCSGRSTLTGNLFTGNTVTAQNSSKAAVVVLGSSAANSVVAKNAFVSNTIAATGNNANCVWANDASADLSGNYWTDGTAPDFGYKEAGKDIYLNITEGFTAPSVYATGYTANTDKNGASVELPAVAQIGDVKYASLAEAIAAVPTNGTETTIVMIGDEVLEKGVSIPAGKNIVLDLNGHTVSSVKNEAAGSALIINSGTLTITDSSEEGTGKLTTEAIQPDLSGIPGYANNTITNHGTLTVNGGSIINTSSKGLACYAIDNQNYGGGSQATLTITGGTVTSTGQYAIRMWLNSTKMNTVTITGGIVKSLWVQDGAADNMGELTIKDATFTGDVTVGYYDLAEHFALDIEDSTFGGLVQYELDATKEGNTIVYKNNVVAPFYMTQPSKILDDTTGYYIIKEPVNIGWVWVETGTESNYPNAEGLGIDLDSIYPEDETGNWYQGYMTVEGQIERFKQYIKDGYELVETETPDKYKIVKKEVAQIVETGEKYKTLQEAFDAATAGQTVQMIDDVDYGVLDDVTTKATLSAGKKVILDLNGHTIKGTKTNKDKNVYVIKNLGDLTVVDMSEGKAGKILLDQDTTEWNYGTDGVAIENHGKLTVNSGTIEATRTSTGMIYAIDCRVAWEGTVPSLTINGGTIKSSYAAIRLYAQNNIGTDDIKAVVNGGTIESDWAFFLQDGAGSTNKLDVDINGGTFTSGKDMFFMGLSSENKANVTISEGEGKSIVSTNGRSVITYDYDGAKNKVSFVIESGKFSFPDNAFVRQVNYSGEAPDTGVSVSGGYFTDDIDGENNDEGSFVVENKACIDTPEADGNREAYPFMIGEAGEEFTSGGEGGGSEGNPQITGGGDDVYEITNFPSSDVKNDEKYTGVQAQGETSGEETDEEKKKIKDVTDSLEAAVGSGINGISDIREAVMEKDEDGKPTDVPKFDDYVLKSAQLKITIKSAVVTTEVETVSTVTATKVTSTEASYDVKPYILYVSGDKVYQREIKNEELKEKDITIRFALEVPSAIANVGDPVLVTHTDPVSDASDSKVYYVENYEYEKGKSKSVVWIEANSFSTYTLKNVNYENKVAVLIGHDSEDPSKETLTAYETAFLALEAAKSGDTVVLVNHATRGQEVETHKNVLDAGCDNVLYHIIKKDVTLDLNGYNLESRGVIVFGGILMDDSNLHTSKLLVENKYGLTYSNSKNSNFVLGSEMDDKYVFPVRVEHYFIFVHVKDIWHDWTKASGTGYPKYRFAPEADPDYSTGDDAEITQILKTEGVEVRVEASYNGITCEYVMNSTNVNSFAAKPGRSCMFISFKTKGVDISARTIIVSTVCNFRITGPSLSSDTIK